MRKYTEMAKRQSLTKNKETPSDSRTSAVKKLEVKADVIIRLSRKILDQVCCMSWSISEEADK
jgi:hypothetical protein